jgi:hypothetical protein
MKRIVQFLIIVAILFTQQQVFGNQDGFFCLNDSYLKVHKKQMEIDRVVNRMELLGEQLVYTANVEQKFVLLSLNERTLEIQYLIMIVHTILEQMYESKIDKLSFYDCKRNLECTKFMNSYENTYLNILVIASRLLGRDNENYKMESVIIKNDAIMNEIYEAEKIAKETKSIIGKCRQ